MVSSSPPTNPPGVAALLLRAAIRSKKPRRKETRGKEHFERLRRRVPIHTHMPVAVEQPSSPVSAAGTDQDDVFGADAMLPNSAAESAGTGDSFPASQQLRTTAFSQAERNAAKQNGWQEVADELLMHHFIRRGRLGRTHLTDSQILERMMKNSGALEDQLNVQDAAMHRHTEPQQTAGASADSGAMAGVGAKQLSGSHLEGLLPAEVEDMDLPKVDSCYRVDCFAKCGDFRMLSILASERLVTCVGPTVYRDFKEFFGGSGVVDANTFNNEFSHGIKQWIVKRAQCGKKFHQPCCPTVDAAGNTANQGALIRRVHVSGADNNWVAKMEGNRYRLLDVRHRLCPECLMEVEQSLAVKNAHGAATGFDAAVLEPRQLKRARSSANQSSLRVIRSLQQSASAADEPPGSAMTLALRATTSASGRHVNVGVAYDPRWTALMDSTDPSDAEIREVVREAASAMEDAMKRVCSAVHLHSLLKQEGRRVPASH